MAERGLAFPPAGKVPALFRGRRAILAVLLTHNYLRFGKFYVFGHEY